MTLVCVPITVRDIAPALADTEEARLRGADLVEYRVDEFFDGDDAQIEPLVRLVADSALPCIVTCRSADEGGAYDGDDDARVSLYERLGTSDTPPAYIDVELATYTRSENIRRKIDLAVGHPKQLRDVHTRLILSMHDFDGRPADLTRRLGRAYAEPAASVVKVAYRARSIRDNLELFEILRGAQKPTIALGMGEFGLMSRVLAPKFGGFLTFASLHKQSVTAPGQPTIDELLNLYRFRSIGRDTKVYGVIGWPVTQSMSPLVHNAGFEAVGWDGVYLPMPVAADADSENTYASLKATLSALWQDSGLLLSGASITIPFKANIWRLESDGVFSDPHGEFHDVGGTAESREMEAANTLAFRWDTSNPDVAVPEPFETRTITNTDAAAIRELLKDQFGTLPARRIALFGTGGVARAAATILAHMGAAVFLVSRDQARARELASSLSGVNREGWEASISASSQTDLLNVSSDAYINCTPVGMAGGPDPDGMSIPINEMTNISPDTVFFDTVYNPIETPMLRAAKARGCRTIDGVQMFVRQAAEQFRLWTGHDAPVELFDRLVRKALGTRH